MIVPNYWQGLWPYGKCQACTYSVVLNYMYMFCSRATCTLKIDKAASPHVHVHIHWYHLYATAMVYLRQFRVVLLWGCYNCWHSSKHTHKIMYFAGLKYTVAYIVLFISSPQGVVMTLLMGKRRMRPRPPQSLPSQGWPCSSSLTTTSEIYLREHQPYCMLYNVAM